MKYGNLGSYLRDVSRATEAALSRLATASLVSFKCLLAPMRLREESFCRMSGQFSFKTLKTPPLAS
jgi:hypothetical protein